MVFKGLHTPMLLIIYYTELQWFLFFEDLFMEKADMNWPLVSVAIITYNQRDYLKECIESVLAQGYSNIEIVIADDGSSDGTDMLLNDYQTKYPGKFVIRLNKSNQGITKNCNIALEACKGKYIAFLGGDDIMLPQKLSKQVQYMESHENCSICYHNVEVFQSETGKLLNLYNNWTNSYEGGMSSIIKYGTFFAACAVMIKKENAPEGGFNERIPIASDWLFFVECLGSGGTINYINEVLGRYRRHNKNITNRVSKTIYLNDLDHINSTSILLFKYPKYGKEVMHRFSTVFRQSRNPNNESYYVILIMSLKMHFNIKSFVLLMVAILSFGYKKM